MKTTNKLKGQNYIGHVQQDLYIYNIHKSIQHHIQPIKVLVINRSNIAKAAHLQRGGNIGVSSLTYTLLWFCVDTFSALSQNHINLHINQQCDDEGNIEGHDGGVHYKGRIGDHAERLITSSCGDKHRANKDFTLYFSQK